MQKDLQDWKGEQLISCVDEPTGSLILIGIHSSVLGPATGGTRMMSYDSEEAALRDCLRLSKSMTHKFAMANFPRGGGKAVIATPPSLSEKQRRGLLFRYGLLLKRLNGLFYTGPDMGITSDDLNQIGLTAPNYVFCKTDEDGQGHQSGEATALGVLSAIKTTIRYLYGSDELKDRTIIIQGAGSVGKMLILLLLEESAKVIFTDIDIPDKRMIEKGAIFVEPDEIYHQKGDIFSPCAQGGILKSETIYKLNCKAIVGAANNQLAYEEAGIQLKEKGILYAPDFVVNIGGAMSITGIEALNWSREKAALEIANIGATLDMIFHRAREQNINTVTAALEIVTQRLAEKKEMPEYLPTA